MRQNRLAKVKRIIPALLAAVIMLSVCGCGDGKKENVPEEKEKTFEGPLLGLHVGDDGIIYLDGNKFYGMGFNWHGGFTMALDKKQRETLPTYFAALKDAGVPFIRTMIGPFYTTDIQLYLNDRDRWFDAMDYFIGLAEEYHVGIVASYWNWGGCQELCGEDLDKIADPYGKGTAMQSAMMTDIMTRYKDSPAIWAWEIANEADLSCEVSSYKNKEIGMECVITSDMVAEFYRIISDVMRENDPYRMITNGDGGLRGSWNSLRLYQSWEPKDTEEDYDREFEFFTQGGMDSFSIHYPEGADIKKHVERSRKLGIGLFIGEFHSTEGFTTGQTDSAGTKEREGWETLVSLMLDADVQLMCHWCWGRCIQQWFDGTSVEIGLYRHYGEDMYQNYYVWDRVKEINADFAAQGKNNAAGYWEKYGELSFKDSLSEEK